jgi:hypothetical protein
MFNLQKLSSLRTAAAAGLLLLFPALAASAASVDGVWQTSYTNEEGQIRIATLTLKMDGDHLTGGFVGPHGRIQIASGAVQGEDVSFTVVSKGNGDEIPITFRGKIQGDSIQLTMQLRDRKPIPMLAKRSN